MAAGTGALAAAGGPIGLGITVGLIGLQSIVGIIAGHGKAVQNEAQLLNIAVPTYSANLQAIFNALQSGQISEQQAKQAIDNAVADYYAGVSGQGRGSIRGRGTINESTCSAGPKVDPCNAACFIGYHWIDPWACSAKRLIDTGGDFQGTSIPSNGQIQANPGIQLHYSKPLIHGLTGTKKNAAIGIGAAAIVGLGAMVFMKH